MIGIDRFSFRDAVGVIVGVSGSGLPEKNSSSPSSECDKAGDNIARDVDGCKGDLLWVLSYAA